MNKIRKQEITPVEFLTDQNAPNQTRRIPCHHRSLPSVPPEHRTRMQQHEIRTKLTSTITSEECHIYTPKLMLHDIIIFYSRILQIIHAKKSTNHALGAYGKETQP